jgi:hypothetical protein
MPPVRSIKRDAAADPAPRAFCVRPECASRYARLFLNGSDEPSLIVNGLKGEDLRGNVALWGYPDEEAYFSNVRISPTSPKPIKNGSDATGTWQVKLPGDTDVASGSIKPARDGNKLTGTFSGDMGKDLPVQGLWRDGYVDMTFRTLPNSSQVTAHLAGWIDGASAEGRITSTAAAPNGISTATRQQGDRRIRYGHSTSRTSSPCPHNSVKCSGR